LFSDVFHHIAATRPDQVLFGCSGLLVGGAAVRWGYDSGELNASAFTGKAQLEASAPPVFERSPQRSRPHVTSLAVVASRELQAAAGLPHRC